jgi:hypothetical protein
MKKFRKGQLVETQEGIAYKVLETSCLNPLFLICSRYGSDGTKKYLISKDELKSDTLPYVIVYFCAGVGCLLLILLGYKAFVHFLL